ncbi:MAG: homocysteine biosynthesis protein, partial [Pseudothermotoga sp.]
MKNFFRRSRMMKTIEQINEKIKNKKAVILTAEEVVRLAKESSPEQIAQTVDVVTTATFAP